MSDDYPSDYKHFDILIWQLPGWSTAIFVLAITGLSFIADAKFSTLHSGLSNTTIAIGFLLVCLIFQLAVFNALVRFRDHQTETINKDDFIFAKWWYSGQFWFQNAVIFQSGALLFLVLSIAKESIAILFSIVLMIVLFFYSLLTVYFKSR